MFQKIDSAHIADIAIPDYSSANFSASDDRADEILRFLKAAGSPIPALFNQPHNLSAELSSFHDAKGYMYIVDEQVTASLIYPVVISRGVASPTHFTKRSELPMYQLIYTHSGAGMLHLDNHMYPLLPGSFCLLDCRPYHYFFTDSAEGWDYSFIHFEGSSARMLYDAAKRKGVVWENMRHSEVRRLYGKIFELSESDAGDFAGHDFEVSFHRLMTDLLCELSNAEINLPDGHSKVPAWFGNVQTYIVDHYNETISIDKLADIAHLSSSHFAHSFKDYLGLSPIEYQYRLRINHACEYLTLTDRSIEEIADLVGFNNVTNFYVIFKKQAGCTPARYKKMQREL